MLGVHSHRPQEANSHSLSVAEIVGLIVLSTILVGTFAFLQLATEGSEQLE